MDCNTCELLRKEGGTLGYLSAAITKSAGKAAGAIKTTLGSVSRTVTACSQKLRGGTVQLHPDAKPDKISERAERRLVQKQLTAKTAFTTLHLLGLVTVVAFPAMRRSGARVVAVQTRSKARTGPATGAADCVPASEEDDEGI